MKILIQTLYLNPSRLSLFLFLMISLSFSARSDVRPSGVMQIFQKVKERSVRIAWDNYSHQKDQKEANALKFWGGVLVAAGVGLLGFLGTIFSGGNYPTGLFFKVILIFSLGLIALGAILWVAGVINSVLKKKRAKSADPGMDF